MSDLVKRLRHMKLIGSENELHRTRRWAKERNEAADRIEALEAEIARLREAMELCPPDKPQMSGEEFREAINVWWKLHARAALTPPPHPEK